MASVARPVRATSQVDPLMSLCLECLRRPFFHIRPDDRGDRRMYIHGTTCLEGPLTKARPWWTPEEDLGVPTPALAIK